MESRSNYTRACANCGHLTDISQELEKAREEGRQQISYFPDKLMLEKARQEGIAQGREEESHGCQEALKEMYQVYCDDIKLVRQEQLTRTLQNHRGEEG